jgi:hypothetical protein
VATGLGWSDLQRGPRRYSRFLTGGCCRVLITRRLRSRPASASGHDSFAASRRARAHIPKIRRKKHRVRTGIEQPGTIAIRAARHCRQYPGISRPIVAWMSLSAPTNGSRPRTACAAELDSGDVWLGVLTARGPFRFRYLSSSCSSALQLPPCCRDPFDRGSDR